MIRRHPLVAFFVLAYALTWWVYPLLVVSPLLAAVLHVLVGPGSALPLGRLSVLELLLVVLVAGEELGWRGFALPRLLERFSPLVASLVLGLLWGLWHLPTFFIAGTPQHGQPVLAFMLLTIAYSIMLTWIWGPPAAAC